MCDKCGIDHPEVGSIPNEIFDTIRDLSLEQRHLFIDSALRAIQGFLVSTHDQEDRNAMIAGIELATNSINLVGFANALTGDDHTEWTSTGDKKVTAVWEGWIEFIREQQSQILLTDGDIPKEVIERFADGSQTDEDVTLVKQIIAARHGVPDDKLDEIGINIEKVWVPDRKDAEPEKPETPGFYL